MRLFHYKYLFLYLTLLLQPAFSFSQLNIGFPIIKNFKRFDYQGGTQNWMISQSNEGLMYFANNDGVLEFDGTNWQLFPLPDKSVVRSVYADTSGRIYVGDANDFGYFERNKEAKLEFFSLFKKSNIDRKNYQEIWKIHRTNDGIVFQSYTQLIILKDDKIKIINAKSILHFSFYVKGKLYVADNKYGIQIYQNGKLTPVEGTEFFKDKEVTSIIPYFSDIMITTLDNGIFIFDGKNITEWKNNISESLKFNQIFKAIRINNELIAFGTVQNGLLICSNKGDVVLHVNEAKGLQNNTILSMKLDNQDDLWLGTDNGIVHLNLNSPFRLINKFNGISTGYTAILHNTTLFLGTNRGVFYKDYQDILSSSIDENSLQIIEETKGQVWALQEIDGKLFCGHNNGAYIINDKKAKKITDIRGVWHFIQPPGYTNKIIAGTYNGIILFEKINGKWQYSKTYKGFNESSRVMCMDDDGSLWISHVYKGVYNIKFSKNYDKINKISFYGDKKGFPSNFDINVTKLKNKVVFLTEFGIFEYNRQKDIMEPSIELNSIFGIKNINYGFENKNGDIWIFYDNKPIVYRLLEDGTYSKIELPFNPLQRKFVDDFEFVYPLSENNILIGYEDGFINYSTKLKKNYNVKFNAFIKKISLSKNDSTLFKGKLFNKNNVQIKLNYEENGVHFFFSAIDYENSDKIEFSTYLQGYNQTWSEWTKLTGREYTNLHEGNYVFYVKAKNIYGVESDPVKIIFTIKPPFHRTNIAYAIYLLLIISAILLIIYLIFKRIEKVKIREKQIQKQKYEERARELQREALIAEKEIIKLRNDKLRAEMRNKDKELAESTMHTIKKNQFLIQLKKELNKTINTPSNTEKDRNIKSLVKKINNDISNEDDWKIFEKHFFDVHEEFLNRFKKQYPQITPSELRLCACLRMNLSTKEIASLFNISIRGVETSRYRLRKALNLDRNNNLTDFILSF